MIVKIKNRLGRALFNWRKILMSVGVVLAVLTVIFQFIYPADKLALLAYVDGVNVGGWQKSDAIKKLDDAYTNATISVYFGQSAEPLLRPTSSDIGLGISNESRINVIEYPWYLRIIPTSILWSGFINAPNAGPTYTRNEVAVDNYLDGQFGDSCNIPPRDASLRANKGSLEVVSSQSGGNCNINVLRQDLLSIGLHPVGENRINIAVQDVLPTVTDDMARQFGVDLQNKLSNGILVESGAIRQLVSAAELFQWMDFVPRDGRLDYDFNAERATAYFNTNIALSMYVKPGTTTITTMDFIETSRIDGAVGRSLDVASTLAGMKDSVNGGGAAAVVTMAVPPLINYIRSYSHSDVGLSALVQQYDVDHDGSFAVSMYELSGRGRRVGYNDTVVGVSASTYKLFVAYSTLKRIESGVWHWSDSATEDNDIAGCFDNMIVWSDNYCTETLMEKIGYRVATDEAHEIGCYDTAFISDDGYAKTSSADLSSLLARLQTGQILTQQSSRDRLIDAMMRNTYREGIPAGVGGSVVADKVGFINGVLNDAAIVYSPTGIYVLVIMTDGSSWDTIADLASKIEELRTN